MVRGIGDHADRSRLSPLRSITLPFPRHLKLSRLGKSSGQSPLRPRPLPSFPCARIRDTPGAQGAAEGAPPYQPPTPAPVHPGALRTATGGGSSPGPPPAAASRGAGADPCAERLLRVKVCRELAHSGPGRGRLWGHSSGISTTAPGPPRAVGDKGGRGRTRRGKAETRPAGSALGPRDSRQQPPALDPRTKNSDMPVCGVAVRL